MIDNLVLIIGAMKAGTTTLFDHLAQHPEIAGCSPKEPGYFAFDEIYEQGDEWYEALFEYDSAVHKFGLDGSTDYSKFPHCKNVVDRVRAFGRPTKIIYIVRHPLRRIESHARHVQFARKELGQSLSSIADHSLDAGISPVSLDASRYAYQLDQYQSFFQQGDLLVLSLEQLSSDPEETLDDVFRFLGLVPSLAPRGVAAKNTASQAQRKNEAHPLWSAARSIGPLRHAIKRLIPDRLRERMRRSTRPKATVSGRFQLFPEEEEALLRDLTPDLRKLRDRYGFDIKAAWGLDV